MLAEGEDMGAVYSMAKEHSEENFYWLLENCQYTRRMDRRRSFRGVCTWVERSRDGSGTSQQMFCGVFRWSERSRTRSPAVVDVPLKYKEPRPLGSNSASSQTTRVKEISHDDKPIVQQEGTKMSRLEW